MAIYFVNGAPLYFYNIVVYLESSRFCFTNAYQCSGSVTCFLPVTSCIHNISKSYHSPFSECNHKGICSILNKNIRWFQNEYKHRNSILHCLLCFHIQRFSGWVLLKYIICFTVLNGFLQDNYKTAFPVCIYKVKW